MRHATALPMKYQLILQWSASAIQDYDTLIAVENALIDALPEGSEVDGHDSGSGEINIFIYTNEPVRVFDELRSTLVDLESSRQCPCGLQKTRGR